jgi:hypothetical protein
MMMEVSPKTILCGSDCKRSDLYLWNRNPQGIAKNPLTGKFKQEHAPQGGDEINIIKKVNNCDGLLLICRLIMTVQ